MLVTCASLTAGERPCTRLPVVGMSSRETCLFRSSAHFLIRWYFVVQLDEFFVCFGYKTLLEVKNIYISLVGGKKLRLELSNPSSERLLEKFENTSPYRSGDPVLLQHHSRWPRHRNDPGAHGWGNRERGGTSLQRNSSRPQQGQKVPFVSTRRLSRASR